MSGTSSKGVDRRAMGALSSGHLFTDLNQGAVAALLPFLISERGLSLAAAGALVFAATVSSSVVQPLFGVFSDRRPIPALMPLGVLLAGIGMALVGVAPGYLQIFLCIVVSGIGVAAFHPESARFANYVSGSRRARGMSFFSVGGNAGFALGPVVATPLVLAFGLPGTLFLALPAALMAAALFYEIPRMRRFAPEDIGNGGEEPGLGPGALGAIRAHDRGRRGSLFRVLRARRLRGLLLRARPRNVARLRQRSAHGDALRRGGGDAGHGSPRRQVRADARSSRPPCSCFRP